MSIDMSQFYQAFFDEAEELLAEAEHLLLALDLDNPDSEDLNAIFRAAHSIKGGAATFGMTDMAEITHVLENLLDKIRKNEMALTGEHVDTFLEAKDVLNSQLEGHRSGADVDRDVQEEVKRKLKALSEGKPVSAAAEMAAAAASAAAPAAPKPAVVAPAAVVDKMRHYNIDVKALSEKDTANLEGELGLLGDVSSKRLDNGHVAFSLKTEDSEDDIISICAFIVEPEDIKITLQSAAAAPGAAAAPADGKQRYNIEVPELSDKDAENLKSELALLGDVSISKAGGKTIFALTTEDSKDSIESICSFVVDLETLVIKDAPSASAAAPAEDLAVASNGFIEGDGFGFFEPITPPPAAPAAEPEPEPAKPVEAAPAPVIEKKPAAAKKEVEKAAAVETTSIRVGVEKVDQLINLVGELVITQAMLEERISKLDPVTHEDLLNSLGQLTRNTRDLQESVMSIRMMPMDYVFSRFPRMVRDLATRLGKKVEFVTSGAATELDKGLIERIVDPLTHLVRNSIDHGIEVPDVRHQSGKNETGRLSLSASNRGGNIVIEVTDDGAGLNRERILSKAKQSGLPVSDTMPDSDVWQLIFAPGFSTAEQVTDVSGRGVGMDVVKRNVSAMGGVIDIRSALGYGTTMSISLPLTLAILDGMSVSLGDNMYVVPLNLIVETMQPQATDIKTVTGAGFMVHVRGEYLPIIPLYSLFNQPTQITNPVDGVLVIIEAEGKKAALFVDGLVGQQQVVIKSLETNYRKVPGVSGATIMGDGSVALILDVPTIIKMGQNNNSEGVYQ
ncbi:chemotaxis protein CheW [Methylovorus menthalis]|uniref:chemotaxis protein CheW n=1 Tax=Methylovorus menthalis TaxID=1002227 RepID=UPI001E2EA9B8|nr:chemotaxis protein CheW [Methylovorus menthalis]MCB4812306.1 chemotaxis protein CheW [Methylovorus menthalis]